MRPRTSSVRSGVVLLVVIALLMLFAIVGIAFVIYAEAQASTARIRKESESLRRADMDPEELFAYFLGQLVYDTDNPYSALRGHGLARNMYGRPGSYVPFNGTGRVHTPGSDEYHLINYQQFGAAPRNPDGIGSPNPSYTYPDINHPFLAAVRASDGAVLIQSYQRHAHAGFNGNWNDPSQRQRVLRPLPGDHQGFPAPVDAGGDVKNLADSPGYLIPGGSVFANNDSYWIDVGHPVMTAPDGRRFKPLFAPLISDLDSRLNVNVHGNIRGSTDGGVAGGVDPRQGRCLTDQGLGPWEVNPRHVLWARDNYDGTVNANGHWEMRRLFIGNLDGNWNQTIRGRYDIMYPPGAPPAGRVVGRWGEDGHRLPERYAIRGPNYAPINGDANFPNMGIRYPGFGAPATSFCPHYDGNFDGWNQGNACRNHPLLYNFFMPADCYYRLDTGGLHFGVSNMEGLLRYGDMGSPALCSDLFYLCPISFGDPVRGGATRRLVTTHTFDIDSPGVTPFLWDGGVGQAGYRLTAGDSYPRGGPLPSPPMSGPPPGSSEFNPNWQAVTSFFGKINLNRDLPRGTMGNAAQESTHITAIAQTGSYPSLVNGRITDMAQFRRATEYRQQFAKDLFDCARLITGGADPVSVNAGPEFDALRWLAQLCVNIVDYIDIDDYMTPFEWKPGEYVFGCELPRVVLNEVYCEVANDPADPRTGGRATLDYKVNFWIELCNPHYNGDFAGQGYALNGMEGNAARLQVGNPSSSSNPATDWACYKIAITSPVDNRLRDSSNIRGEPDAASIKLELASYAAATGFTPTVDTSLVRPGGDTPDRYNAPTWTNTTNEGYVLLAPNAAFPVQDPANKPNRYPEPTLKVRDQQINGKTSALTYSLDRMTDLAQSPQHSVVLRRLACPYLAPQENPALPNYNPYITVDYVETVRANDGVAADSAGTHTSTALARRCSVGRNQPYAAHASQIKDQRPAVQLQNQPQHSFFKNNEQGNPANQGPWPYDWLCFCDRPLVSPLELLQVCAYRPHEMTQQFMTGTDAATGRPQQKFGHRAPWYDENARIYRLFEFLDATSPMQWVPVGGRSTGRMNINNMWDRSIFNALGDRENNNFYSQTDVDRFFEKMVRSRTPGAVLAAGQVTQANLGPNDRPFRGMATAHVAPGDTQYPNGSGIDDTLFRHDPADPAAVPPNQKRRLFEPDAANAQGNGHPYVKYEFMKKVFNSFTTRSNVFAVWVTVGFFEVIDDSDPTRPPVLGPEMGKAESRNVRHRMFAILDRTNLTVAFDPNSRQITQGQPGPRPFFLPSHTPVVRAGPATIKVPSSQRSNAAQKTIRADYEGFTWTIKPGDTLVVDSGQNLEVITVADVRIVSLTEAEIDAVFAKPHPARFAISNAVLGNPGPQPRFDPRNPNYHGVVRFTSIIE